MSKMASPEKGKPFFRYNQLTGNALLHRDSAIYKLCLY